MSAKQIARVATAGVIAAALGVGGCAAPREDHQPEVSAPSSSASSPTVTASRTSPTSVPEELTAEEQLRVSPPPPQRVSAVRAGSAVTLTWAPPPPVTVPHTYSDRVVEYRIYRSGDSGGEVLVGTSATLTFTDARPGAGTPRYAVSSVREHGVEGSRSDAVAAPAAS